MKNMEKFKNKYRIPSARLPYWDYGQNAAYFVTICTKNREHLFGEIIVETSNVETPKLGVSTNKMVLSQIGELVEKYWLEIPEHFPFVKLDAFVVMPNHVHGIIIIDKKDDGSNVETTHALSLPSPPKPIIHKRFQNQGKNTVSSIVGSFKSVVTKNARTINPHFAWQSRFYDHIIRNEKSYYHIIEYIINNPLNWTNDKYYA